MLVEDVMQPGDGDGELVAILLAQAIERMVDLLDHGQDAARVDVGQAARHQHGVLLLGDEAPHQMLGQDADELLHRTATDG